MTIKELKNRLERYDGNAIVGFIKEDPKDGTSFMTYDGEKVTMDDVGTILVCFK